MKRKLFYITVTGLCFLSLTATGTSPALSPAIAKEPPPAHQTAPEEPSPRVVTTDSLYLAPVPENPRTSEGDFVILKNDRILSVNTKFAGGGSDHDGAVLAGRISKDNGRTWSEDFVVVENEGGRNVMSVTLLRLQNGRIALFYLVKNSLTDCYPVMRLSSDEAQTWSAPVACIPPGTGYFVLNNNRVIQLDNGRLLLPVACHSKNGTSFNPNGVITCFYSDDSGATWHESRPVEAPEGVVKQEPGVIALKDGRLLMYIRTGSGFQYFSYSSDAGHTWSVAVEGTLRSAQSPALIVRDPWTQQLTAIWNDHPTQRTPLCLAVSGDEGQTWTSRQIIENDPALWYCYPSFKILSQGLALVSYCLGDKKKAGLAGMLIRRIRYTHP
jgi:hypothetical protein